MHKSIIALGVESSCDETSIGIIKSAFKDDVLITEKLGLSRTPKKNYTRILEAWYQKSPRVRTQKK